MLMILLAALLQSAVPTTPGDDPPSPDVDRVLRSAGIDPGAVGLRESELALMVGERARSALSRLLMTEPLRADETGLVVAELLEAGAREQVVDCLSTLSRFNGRVMRRGLIGDPLEPSRELADQDETLDGLLQRGGVPESVAEAAKLLLAAARESRVWIRRARAAADDDFWRELEDALRKPLPTAENPEQDDDDEGVTDFDLRQKAVFEAFDAQWMNAAAQDLTFAVAHAAATLREDERLASAEFHLRVKTDLGWIILAGAGDHEHAADGPILLVIDTAGDDTYTQAGANGGRDAPIGLALDLAGDDTYRADDDALAAFGGGVMGVGLLWDDAGDDTYDAPRRALGAGICGVGVLVDAAGDDTYRGVDDCQGAATAGYGLLVDRAGDDRYESWRASQGFAGPNAAAALVDLAGSDEYIANDSEIRFPSPQSDEHNVSMCQGAATGWRADYSDGVSINGGVGVLLDCAGNDTYSCGVFGQGVGYWYGIGLLIDRAGDDRYSGQWYVQGAAAHFAAGVLLDQAGADHYAARMNMSQGAGHDLSIGVLVESAGDDVYEGSTLGLGASNAAGIGLFVDRAGNDTYRTPSGRCVGWANPNRAYRRLFASWGLFIDLAGSDAYEGRAEAGDASRWSGPPDPAVVEGSRAWGIGIDASAAAEKPASAGVSVPGQSGAGKEGSGS